MPVDRREVLTIIGQFSALAWHHVTRDRWARAASELDIFGDIPKSLGSEHLHYDALSILDQFVTARSGQLMAHYQTFWPFARDEQALSAIARVSAIKSGDQAYVNQLHRIRALPAVAAVHTLSMLDDPHSREAAAGLILTTHAHALDAEPHREVLEIIWQNVTAAIIRDRHNWNSLCLDNALLEQGRDICKRYLSGEEMLLSPALLTLHALLTYEKALAQRGDIQLPAVRRILSDIRESTNNYWFSELFEIMQNRNRFEDALPQLSEVVMGFEGFQQNVSDYAILSRLYLTYLIKHAAEGRLVSPYQSVDRAKEAAKVTLAFIGDYCITPLYWARLHAKAEQRLPPQAVRYLDSVFSTYENSIGHLLKERGEQLAAQRLRTLIPFRQQQRAVEAAYPETGSESLPDNALKYGPGLFGILKAAEPAIRRLTGEPNGKVHISELHDRIEQDEPASVLRKPMELYREALDRLKSSTRTTLGAAGRHFLGGVVRDASTSGNTEAHMQKLHGELLSEARARLDSLLTSPSPLAGERHVSAGVNLRDAMRRSFDFFADSSVEGRKKREELRARLAAENPDNPFFVRGIPEEGQKKV